MLTKLGRFSANREKKSLRVGGEIRQRLEDKEVRNKTYISNFVEILHLYFCSFTRERTNIYAHEQVLAINSAEGNKSVSSWQGSRYSYKIQTSLLQPLQSGIYGSTFPTS